MNVRLRIIEKKEEYGYQHLQTKLINGGGFNAYWGSDMLSGYNIIVKPYKWGFKIKRLMDC